MARNGAAGDEHARSLEFAAKLNRLKDECGASLSELSTLMSDDRRFYPVSTIHDKLTGKTRPSWEFVVACYSYAGWPDPDPEPWHEAYRRMKHGNDDPLAAQREQHLAGERVCAGGDLRTQIHASWSRVGIKPHVTEHFAGEPSLDTPLLRYGQPVVHDLLDGWPGQSVSVVLADSDVVVCSRRSNDEQLDRRLKRHFLAPGHSYLETFAGTNGLGTAFASGETAWVIGSDHLAEELQDDACFAALVMDPRANEIAGLVNLTCRRDAAHRLMIPIVEQTARRISDA
ncbi:MAG: hypothetical protein ACRD0P_30920, partial [Stackebrandtia sp.]